MFKAIFVFLAIASLASASQLQVEHDMCIFTKGVIDYFNDHAESFSRVISDIASGSF